MTAVVTPEVLAEPVVTAAPSTSLAIFEQAAQMLAEADTVQAAKALKNLALTVAEWARRTKLGHDAEQHCREYALRAERKMGEMLSQKPNPSQNRLHGKDSSGSAIRVLPENADVPTLEQLGISKKESVQSQKLARLPEPVFEKVAVGELTKAAAFRKQKQGPEDTGDEADRDTGNEVDRKQGSLIFQLHMLREKYRKIPVPVMTAAKHHELACELEHVAELFQKLAATAREYSDKITSKKTVRNKAEE